MAKKRIIKKSLHYIMSDLFTATIIAAAGKDGNAEKATEVQEKILAVYADYNSRLSNYERGNAKKFFKQYKAEINKEIEGIINAISEI